jgi:predicted ester cyclase
MIVNDDFNKEFANEWISAWNSHNIDLIMSHYVENIAFHSPLIIKLNINPEGTIKNKSDLREYFLKGLTAYPDLHFDLHSVLSGKDSVVLYYESINQTMSAEFMQLNNEGKVTVVRAHYCSK